jgi:hypothetical protein
MTKDDYDRFAMRMAGKLLSQEIKDLTSPNKFQKCDKVWIEDKVSWSINTAKILTERLKGTL